MAEHRRPRRRPESQAIKGESDKPEKIEYEIAKFLRSGLPPKQTTLCGHKVDYFIGSRAIDLLMNSKWAQTDKRTDKVMFPNRESATDFMNKLLRHQFFHRAKAIIVKKEIVNVNTKKQTDIPEEASSNSSKNEQKKSKSSSSNDKQQKKDDPTLTPNSEKIKKEKKKVKLDMHMEQIFVDLNEPYVWIYDYIPMKTWLIGGGLVIAAIAICLFPLWPRTVRNYVYYLSIAVAIFLFFIIALALLKLVVFAVVWVLTLGKHHLWILPNLTEDVGFFESFWPLYKHEYRPGGGDDCKKENEDSKNQPTTSGGDPGKQSKKQKNDRNEDEEYQDHDDEEEEEMDDPQPGNSNGNEFEMIDSKECDED